MALLPGHRIGVYPIAGPLVVGGWSEVHRAHDGRLRRDVEINVASAADRGPGPAGGREAETLAAPMEVILGTGASANP